MPIAPHNLACQHSLSSMLLSFNLGIPTAPHETQGHSTTLEFMGIVLDSDGMEARLPPDKVQRLTSCFTEFKGSRSCTLKELQSLMALWILLARLFPRAGHSCKVWSSSLGTSLYLTIVLSWARVSLKILGCGRILYAIGIGQGFLCNLIGSLQMSCLCTQMPLVLWDLGTFFKPTGFRAHGNPIKN